MGAAWKYFSLLQLVEEDDRTHIGIPILLLTMKEGTKVKIKGLVKNLFFNDKIGIVVKEASGDEERAGVKVIDPNGCTAVLGVKIGNLEFISPHDKKTETDTTNPLLPRKELRDREQFLDSGAILPMYDTYLHDQHTTMDTPHKMVQFQGSTYFIARFPAGDYIVCDELAYEDHLLGPATFLLEDGTFKTASMGMSQIRDTTWIYKALVEKLPGCKVHNKAYKMCVGRGTVWSTDDAVYKDEVWTIESIQPRMRAEWRGLSVLIKTRQQMPAFVVPVNRIMQHANISIEELEASAETAMFRFGEL